MSTTSKVLPWVLTALLTIAFPIVAYDMATDRGVSEVAALIISSIGPLVEMAITWIWRKRLDELSTVVLLFLVVGVVATLFFDDPKLLLLKEAIVTGLFGIVMLASLLTARPLTFLFGRRFATGGDPARVAWWNGLWEYQGFRRTQRGLTTMWGAAFVLEALVRSWLTFQLSTGTMVAINALAPPAIILVLIVITIVWGKRAAAAGAARARAAGLEPAPPPPPVAQEPA